MILAAAWKLRSVENKAQKPLSTSVHYARTNGNALFKVILIRKGAYMSLSYTCHAH